MAIVGGCLVVAAGLIILMVGVFVIPHLNSSVFNNINSPGSNVTIQNPQGFVGSILTGVGAFGLVCGTIVLVSGIMLRTKPEQSSVFGVLILTFSVLSFFGTGGFVVGAILGIVGGVMTLRWRRPAALAQAPSS